ncbi:MAG: hypothetical protein ACRDTR_19925 [Rubrobacter sp.]
MRVRELQFEEVPEPEVRFLGNTRRNSVWGSRRENLPDEVQEGVVYRNAGVRLRIASEVADSGPGFRNSLEKGRVKTDLEYRWGRKTREQEPESKEEKQ